MYYMYNKWSYNECVTLFGDILGAHIMSKLDYYKNDILRWYAELDNSCRNKIVKRADELYGK